MTDLQVFKNQHAFTTDKDISSEAFWALSFDERDKTFAWLREHAPVSWHPPLESPNVTPEMHGEAGFWAVVRAAEVAYVSQNPELFSSDSVKYGPAMVRPSVPDFVPRASFIGMDPPRHTSYRRVLSKYFTPRGVARLQDKLADRSAQIVDQVVGAGEIDFVSEVSAKLPMRTIADLLGVPEDLIEAFATAGDNMVEAQTAGFDGADDPIAFVVEQMAVLGGIGMDLVNHRRKHPADDLATALAEVEVDGLPLDHIDIQVVMVLLAIAGNDTTKQTTSHAVVQLWRHPDQRAWLVDDYESRIGNAIEEFVRHTTPVMCFARTATADLELVGQQIQAGDKVAMFYSSANRDEAVCPEPHRFDITRPPNAHQGFGGGGVHYCLGNILAKAELKALFREILTKLPHMEVGEPEFVPGEFLHAVRRLPVNIP